MWCTGKPHLGSSKREDAPGGAGVGAGNEGRQDRFDVTEWMLHGGIAWEPH